MTSTAIHTPALAAFAQQKGEHWVDALNDGSPVLIRPLRAEDRDREKAFIENLSPTTRHHRFLGEVKEVGEALLSQLMDVDGHERVAYVALVHDNGSLREIGISRYATIGADMDTCEFAVTVADEWQHKGLDALLMRHLVARAKDQGFKQMYSLDCPANHRMRELAATLGFNRAIDPDDATQVRYHLAL
ncbi:GNAT family N-acetyltransferase [Pseudomonas chlororaphis]|uniref:GNAT family N-acetyltransferase n=1 Tax=Pseudomonas chlororaphis TaxID=587753 RepID=UPI000F5816A2|nr:GNAT family N-acetyltransferase [Pseudomonas chlororaphis]AZC95274.1 Acetyl-CoA synthetase (ADP-forming) alpha-beta chain, putative [Pseudomonas chlororaphis subsp. piscium]QTT89441.1 GNAT family N-acetyltransferase [Pseudomonas chlororaphis]